MKLSIVTIHLDQWESLERTAKSLSRILNRSDVEWIVVDGGSASETDTEQAIRARVREGSQHFVSEKDHGIYNAMNKGTGLAQGSHMLYLNAGDELHQDFDLDVFWDMVRRSDPGMLWGQAWDKDKNGNVYLRKSRKPEWLKFGIPVCHQSVLFRSNLLGSKPYRESLSIAGDYELLCRLYREGAAIEMIDNPVVVFELTGVSSAQSARAMKEESEVRQQYFPKPAAVEWVLTTLKHLLWKVSMQFPRFRKLWRRRV